MNIDISKLSAADIVAAIEEIRHQILHLNRSQKELEEAIEEDPDAEFIAALKENEGIIVCKHDTIIKLVDALRPLDSTAAKHYDSSLVANMVSKPGDPDNGGAGNDARQPTLESSPPSNPSNPIPGLFDCDDSSMDAATSSDNNPGDGVYL